MTGKPGQTPHHDLTLAELREPKKHHVTMFHDTDHLKALLENKFDADHEHAVGNLELGIMHDHEFDADYHANKRHSKLFDDSERMKDILEDRPAPFRDPPPPKRDKLWHSEASPYHREHDNHDPDFVATTARRPTQVSDHPLRRPKASIPGDRDVLRQGFGYDFLVHRVQGEEHPDSDPVYGRSRQVGGLAMERSRDYWWKDVTEFIYDEVGRLQFFCEGAGSLYFKIKLFPQFWFLWFCWRYGFGAMEGFSGGAVYGDPSSILDQVRRVMYFNVDVVAVVAKIRYRDSNCLSTGTPN